MSQFFKFKKNKKIIKILESDIEALLNYDKNAAGTINLDGVPFTFHHARSFYETYQEVFIKRLYDFKPSGKAPYIIDCGANMGLSVLFFAKNFPKSSIIAFEPDETVFATLNTNIAAFKLNQVTAYKKAVWTDETQMEFYTDSGMGGTMANTYSKQHPKIVETVKLASLLNRKVDLLKIDIEGAEYEVIKDCAALLQNVDHLFVEYHSYINKEQHLDDLLLILKQNGFTYHLKESFSRAIPFIDRGFACENMDMGINIFAYRS
jgi:FkbM family methyltransferase